VRLGLGALLGGLLVAVDLVLVGLGVGVGGGLGGLVGVADLLPPAVDRLFAVDGGEDDLGGEQVGTPLAHDGGAGGAHQPVREVGSEEAHDLLLDRLSTEVTEAEGGSLGGVLGHLLALFGPSEHLPLPGVVVPVLPGRGALGGPGHLLAQLDDGVRGAAALEQGGEELLVLGLEGADTTLDLVLADDELEGTLDLSDRATRGQLHGALVVVAPAGAGGEVAGGGVQRQGLEQGLGGGHVGLHGGVTAGGVLKFVVCTATKPYTSSEAPQGGGGFLKSS